MSSPGSIQPVDAIKSGWQRGLTLKQVAAKFAIDPGSLSRLFRRQKGCTPRMYVDRKRREHVIARLKKGTIFGHEMGTELGFASDRAFYRWVRRVFEVCWREVRRSHSSTGQLRRIR